MARPVEGRDSDIRTTGPVAVAHRAGTLIHGSPVLPGACCDTCLMVEPMGRNEKQTARNSVLFGMECPFRCKNQGPYLGVQNMHSV